MKKLIITLVILGIVCGALIATCPDVQQHRDVVNSRLENATTAYLQDQGLQTDGWGGILSSTIGGLVGKLNLAAQMEVKDYALFSVGSVETSKGNQTISLGILKHVFCFVSEDQIKEFMEAGQRDLSH